jgi:hypothetical protein
MRFALAAVLVLSACSQVPPIAREAPTVTVESVRLNAVLLPEALVRITNDTGRDLGRVSIACEFYRANGELIGLAPGDVDHLADGESTLTQVWSSEQRQRPATATCRVD